MVLSDDYLSYPNRKKGQDIDRYPMQYSVNRPKKSLPSGKSLAVGIIVPLEFFMLNPSGKPFKHPGAMATPYPDLRHFTTRDYGNRVGVFRLLTAFKTHGITATFAVNGALLSRVSPLLEAIVNDGHEVAAHGWDTDSIHWGNIHLDTERSYIERTRDAFEAFGLTPRAWMSPARQESFQTPDLLKRAGFDICLDWEIDTQPTSIKTESGTVRTFPVLNELADWFILQQKHHSEDEWKEQIIEATDMMAAESEETGVAACFGFTMTPYICGQPFRLRSVRETLQFLSSDSRIQTTGVSEIVAAFD